MEVEYQRVPGSGPISSMPGSIFEIYPGRMLIDEAEGNHQLLETQVRKTIPQKNASQYSDNVRSKPPYFFKIPKNYRRGELDLINSLQVGGSIPRVVGIEDDAVPNMYGGLRIPGQRAEPYQEENIDIPPKKEKAPIVPAEIEKAVRKRRRGKDKKYPDPVVANIPGVGDIIRYPDVPGLLTPPSTPRPWPGSAAGSVEDLPGELDDEEKKKMTKFLKKMFRVFL